MELWIPITIAAAFVQNLRFMLQKHLKGRLSTLGATFARFIFAVPLAIFLVVVLIIGMGREIPEISTSFLIYATIGGITQILATALLVSLFSLRNFAVGVSFSKTETIQAVMFGAVILGETVSIGGWVAILVSMIGVIMISVQPSKILGGGIFNRAALIGVGSGAFFGAAAVAYRAASLSLGNGDFLMRAALTLAVVTCLQTVLMAIWLMIKEPGEISRVLGHWRITSLVGLTGMIGSLGWFSAMTLQNVAYVRALGQIELIFTFAASWLVFGERSSRREIGGILFLIAGIILLLLLR